MALEAAELLRSYRLSSMGRFCKSHYIEKSHARNEWNNFSESTGADFFLAAI